MPKGVELLNTIQDVYFPDFITFLKFSHEPAL